MGLSVFLALTFFTTAVISNGLVLIITFKSKKLRKLCYYNITTSLAVCHLMLLLVIIVQTVASGFEHWPLGLEWCHILAALGYALGAITVLHLCAIALERYSVILKPFHYREEVNYPTFGVMILVLWVFPVVFALSPIFADASMYVYNPEVFRCELNWTDKSTPNLLYVAFLAIVYFLVPIVIIGFTYGRMFAVAKSHLRQINSLKPNNVAAGSGRESDRHGHRVYNERTKPQPHQQKQQLQQQQQQLQQQLQQGHKHQGGKPQRQDKQQQQPVQQRQQQLQQGHKQKQEKPQSQHKQKPVQQEQQQLQQGHKHQQEDKPQRQHQQQQQQGGKPQQQRQQYEQSESGHPQILRQSSGSNNRAVIRPNQIRASCPKAVKTIGLIIVIYGICYVPYSLVRIFKVFFPHLVPEVVTTVTLLMALSSLSLNPVVYCFGKRDFRTELLKRLGCLRRVRTRAVVHPLNTHQSGPGSTARLRNGLERKLRLASAREEAYFDQADVKHNNNSNKLESRELTID